MRCALACAAATSLVLLYVVVYEGVALPFAWSGCTLPTDPAWRWPDGRNGFADPALGVFRSRGGCHHCMLLPEIKAWSGQGAVRAYREQVRKKSRRPLEHGLEQGACDPRAGDRSAAKISDTPRHRVANTSEHLAYLDFAARIGAAPLEAGLVSLSRPLSALLFQRGSCGSAAQAQARRNDAGALDCGPLRQFDEVLVDGVALRASPRRGGNGTEKRRPVALLLHDPPFPSPIDESSPHSQNLWHLAAMHAGAGRVWCIMQAVEELRRSSGVRDIRLVADRRRFLAMSPWKRELLRVLAPIWSPADPPVSRVEAGFSRILSAGDSRFGFVWRHYQLDLAPSLPVRSMGVAIRRGLELGRVRAAPRSVLILQRLKDRGLVDAHSGTAVGLAAAMCKLGLAPRFASFDRAPFRKQVETISSAAVLVSPHGSQLTNLLWLDPSAAVVEVTFRYAYCQEKPWQEMQRTADAVLQGSEHCLAYHPTFANMANALGITYRYLDPVYLPPQQYSNPIARSHVHLNARELAELAALLLEEQRAA